MIDKDQFSPFVKALQQHLKQHHPDFDGSLSAVRELVSHALTNRSSNELLNGQLKHSPIPFGAAIFERLSRALKQAYGISMPAEIWRWPLPVAFKLSPAERIEIWQAALNHTLSKTEIDGVWRDNFVDAEPYIKPMGDGKWAVCSRSPVPFWLCRDVFTPEWVTLRNADNSIADDPTGRELKDRLYHAGLSALWKKDYNTAQQRFQEAQEKGHPMAAFNLGWMYSEGLGHGRNFIKAAELYERAAELGLLTAHHNLGGMYLEGAENFPKSIPDAIQHFELAAEGGIAASIGCLGMIYLNGNGVHKDRNRAINLLIHAARLGDDHSLNTVATILDHQNGGVSTPESFALYRAAARSARKLNHVMPILNLGLCFLHGNGVGKNVVKARRLFRIAANAGDADAALNLGLMYLNGEGIPVDSREARYWLKMSAKYGNGDALNVLGAIEFNGQCGAPNHHLAWILFSEAAQMGSAVGLTNQARCLATGQGVEQDIDLAYKLLKQAEAQGHPTARDVRTQLEAQL
ncbi:SEL1-like repeat protein [Alcaligenes faecalis]|uniref:SEL1-like repeat protein n=1 Tax=Alcaligenes faecalis TaxID=511 RepID=UPI0018856646|nr:SEL1-like repeat protein [Alcaligenes faecalis]